MIGHGLVFGRGFFSLCDSNFRVSSHAVKKALNLSVLLGLVLSESVPCFPTPVSGLTLVRTCTGSVQGGLVNMGIVLRAAGAEF